MHTQSNHSLLVSLVGCGGLRQLERTGLNVVVELGQAVDDHQPLRALGREREGTGEGGDGEREGQGEGGAGRGRGREREEQGEGGAGSREEAGRERGRKRQDSKGTVCECAP